MGAPAPKGGRRAPAAVAAHAAPVEALALDDAFEGEVRLGEPMARHTSYRIGGAARYYLVADTLAALQRALAACRQQGVPWVAVGRGSNLLVADEGFDGAVVTLGPGFRRVAFDEPDASCVAGAGALLATVVQEALRRSLSGMEFAVGTPGTVGGAVRMNAGTRDEGIGSRALWVRSVAADGSLVTRKASEVEWGYRSTSLPDDEVVVECALALEPGDADEMAATMQESLRRRKRTQPLDAPSCGSVFRNPEGHSAGGLIEAAGLKGERVGGAQVSERHANFIVNAGGATARDVRALIDLVKAKVLEDYGVELATEVKYLGF